MTIAQVPSIMSAIYTAAAHINQVGPVTVDALFKAVYFGAGAGRMSKLRHAFEINWLQKTNADTIDLTESSRKHFAPQQAKEPYVGQKAPPAHRPNVFATTLSPKYRPNSRGPRADVPDWSRRPADFEFKSVGGGEP